MLLLNVTASAGVPLSVTFDSPVDYLIFIFHIVFATTAVLVAGPVAVAILATRSLRQQNRFLFMLNTSVCDTLVGFSAYYLGLFDVQEGYPSRNGTYNILPALLGVNLMTFLFAQFDRYLAVCHPFFYSRYITRRVVISVNACCWFYNYCQTIFLIFVPLSIAQQVFAFSVASLQVIVLTKVIMTIKLYVVARSQLARDPPGADRESKRESLRIIIFVVVIFLVLWGPAFVNIVTKFVTGRGVTFRNDATNPRTIMARLNAVCTPSVYIWASPALREALLRTVWGRVCPRCRTR
ncbi:somatostatin receptor type 5-like [Clinocottus analis]|uniref:somatostatin receptor type 5-like n=1 Tax=Clinocottus analis TaxID=304258 RepID=UPI0035BF354E